MISNAIEKVFPDGTYQICYASSVSGGSSLDPERGGTADPDRVPDKEASRRASVSRAVETVFEVARANEWDLMVTFTFDPDKVDSFDYAAIIEVMRKFNRRLKAQGVSYIEVPEQHKSGRIHLHAVLADPEQNMELVPAINYYSGLQQFDDGGRPMYDVVDFLWGWCKATYVDDNARSGMAVVKYIMKYMNKNLDWVPEGKKRYFASQGLTRPVKNRLLMSIEDDIMDEISRQADYRKVINTPFGPYVILEIHGGRDIRHAKGEVNKMKILFTWEEAKTPFSGS